MGGPRGLHMSEFMSPGDGDTGPGRRPDSLGHAVSCSRTSLTRRLQPPSRPTWGSSTELAAAAWASTL